MTVYESLVQWLNDILIDPENCFPSIYKVIDLEMIPNWTEYQNAGLFSSPNDIHTSLIGGQQRHTEFRSFYLRLPFSEFTERLRNEVFFEKFRDYIYEKDLDGQFPKDGRDWESIKCNAGISPAQKAEDNSFVDYLVALKLVYVS
jgi:hypothetical protein